MGLFPYANRYPVQRTLPDRGRDRAEVLAEIEAMATFMAAAESDIDIFHVNDHLAGNGWRMNGLQNPPGLHFCISRPNTVAGVMDHFAQDLDDAVAYARDRVGTPPRSGAAYGAGGASVPRDMVQAGMAGWLDATQSLPPTS
jgi:sphinganine-1-phosphate aldolase